MESYTLEPSCQCSECGGPLTSGPFGLRCARCVLSMVSEPDDDEHARVAELFPELRLEGKVARGGFGEVFRAEHRRMKRPVALKFLDTVLARNPEAVALFEQEMISVGGLDHPGIVRAHDAGERDGHWYIIMEFVDGEDCGTLVRKHGALPMAESCEIIRQAAAALHHAHGQGLVHRDVKPGNIMVSRESDTGILPVSSRRLPAGQAEEHPAPVGLEGRQPAGQDAPGHAPAGSAVSHSTVKILDFGLAGLAVAPVFGAPVATGGTTRFLGTLEYTAPEQIEDPANVDARADIYSLGATLWRLLTGKTPHPGSAEVSLFVHMKRITSEPVPSLATVRPDLPKPLVHLCDRMLSLDREKRPATAAEVARLIEPWCAGAELPRLFTDGPLEEKPFVFPKKNCRPLWAAAAALVALGAFLLRPTAPTAPSPNRPLFPAGYFEAQKLSPDNGPRLFSEVWEPESASYGDTVKQYGRLTPDGAVLSVDALMDDSIRHWDRRKTIAAFPLPAKRPVIYALGVAPDGHVVWAMPKDKTGLHIGRAKPDGTLLPSLRYDFGPEFNIPFGLYELGRKALIKKNIPVADGEPRAFAFVTPENLPPNTGLQPGDVLVADYGQREFSAGIQQATGLPVGRIWSIPGLWRFRLDDDAPARRLAKASTAVMPLDVAISKHGVFIIDRAFHNPDGESDDPRHLTDHVWRWDRAGWHSCTTDVPLLTPCGIAADPLSADLYVLCGDENLSRSSDRQTLLRLTPAGPDRYTVTPLVTRLGKADRGGIAFSYDGKRMILTDSGNRVIVVLKRKG